MAWKGRLGRAVGHLALALINATLILVILAALSVGFALRGLENLAEAKLQRIAERSLAAADIDPVRLEAGLTRIGDELAALRTTIAEGGLGDGTIRPALQRLQAQLAEITTLLRNMRDIEIRVDPATLDQLQRIAADLLTRLTKLAASIRGTAPGSDGANPVADGPPRP